MSIIKILIINGPNLNMLGTREPAVYGAGTYAQLCTEIQSACASRGLAAEIFQSNHEGAIVDKIQEALGIVDGIVINPAAYTHTSIAILDALKAVGLPTVEVHLTDVDAREPFRKISYIRDACVATFTGNGFQGYVEAVGFLANYCRDHR